MKQGQRKRPRSTWFGYPGLILLVSSVMIMGYGKSPLDKLPLVWPILGIAIGLALLAAAWLLYIRPQSR